MTGSKHGKRKSKKGEELNIRLANLDWLVGRSSRVTLENKTLIYKTIIKPIWTYDIELSAGNSNVEILQHFENKALEKITEALLFIKICKLHGNIYATLLIPYSQQSLSLLHLPQTMC